MFLRKSKHVRSRISSRDRQYLRCFQFSVIVTHKNQSDYIQTTTLVALSQPAITCSKLITETLEQGVNMFNVNNKDTRMAPLAPFSCFHC